MGLGCQEKDTWDARGRLELSVQRRLELAGGNGRDTMHEEDSSQRILKRQNFLAATTKRLDLNIYIVGAGALIPYKRGDDDVGWFISYSHS